MAIPILVTSRVWYQQYASSGPLLFRTAESYIVLVYDMAQEQEY